MGPATDQGREWTWRETSGDRRSALMLLPRAATTTEPAAPRCARRRRDHVGSFDFPESVLLAEIYSQALEDERVPRSSGRSASARASSSARRCDAGLIELVPEYAGTARRLLQPRRRRAERRPGGERTASSTGVVAGTTIAALDSAPAQNANTFVVTAGHRPPLRPADD